MFWCHIHIRWYSMTEFNVPQGLNLNYAVGLIIRLSWSLQSAVDVIEEDLLEGLPQQGEQRLVGCLGHDVNHALHLTSSSLTTPSVDIPDSSRWTPPLFAGKRHERHWREEGASPPQRNRGTQSVSSVASWDASPHHSITAVQCVTLSCPPQDDMHVCAPL